MENVIPNSTTELNLSQWKTELHRAESDLCYGTGVQGCGETEFTSHVVSSRFVETSHERSKHWNENGWSRTVGVPNFRVHEILNCHLFVSERRWCSLSGHQLRSWTALCGTAELSNRTQCGQQAVTVVCSVFGFHHDGLSPNCVILGQIMLQERYRQGESLREATSCWSTVGLSSSLTLLLCIALQER